MLQEAMDPQLPSHWLWFHKGVAWVWSAGTPKICHWLVNTVLLNDHLHQFMDSYNPIMIIHSHCVQVDENWFQEHSGDPTNCVVTLYAWHELSLAIMGHCKQAYLHTGFCTYRYLDSMVKQDLASLQRWSNCGIDATSNCCTCCRGLTY